MTVFQLTGATRRLAKSFRERSERADRTAKTAAPPFWSATILEKTP